MISAQTCTFGSPVSLRLPLLACIALLLSACASQMPDQSSQLPPIPAAPSIQSQWQEYQQLLGSLEFWNLEGKLGIRTPNDSGSAHLNWKQRPEQFAIHLSGPLGQGSIWIRGDDTQVSLERSGEETLYATTPEQLMYNAMGWWLPVSDLHFWVKGIPAPDTPIEEQQRNDDGTLMSLTQNQWQLSYSRYQQSKGWYLPTKVIARHFPAGQQDAIKLTLIIKDWQLNGFPLDQATTMNHQ